MTHTKLAITTLILDALVVSLALAGAAFAQSPPGAGGFMAPQAIMSPSQVIFSAGVNFNDQSAVAGNLGKFYSPTYFGNAGTAAINKFNRLQIGLEALSTADIITGNHQTTEGWVASYVSIMASSQLAVTNTIGSAAIAGASRTSDYRTAYAAPTGGTGAVVAISISDDSGSISCAFCSYQYQLAGINGIALSQLDMNNRGTALTITPHTGIPAGSTVGLDITAGAKGTVANPNNNSSVGFIIGPGNNNGGAGTPVFEIGQIFVYTSLDTAIGAGGNGVAIEYYTGQSQRWTDATDVVIAEIYGNAGGLVTTKPVTFLTSTLPTYAAGNGAISATAAGGLVIGGNGSSSDIAFKNSAGATALQILSGSTTVYAPNNLTVVGSVTTTLNTGTPTASVCINSGGVLIKKTTAGSCI